LVGRRKCVIASTLGANGGTSLDPLAFEVRAHAPVLGVVVAPPTVPMTVTSGFASAAVAVIRALLDHHPVALPVGSMHCGDDNGPGRLLPGSSAGPQRFRDSVEMEIVTVATAKRKFGVLSESRGVLRRRRQSCAVSTLGSTKTAPTFLFIFHGMIIDRLIISTDVLTFGSSKFKSRYRYGKI
jgi:hypothetical protein